MHTFLCWMVCSTYGVFYFHTPLLSDSTIRALLQTCSDGMDCSVPFSFMNYRQRPCSLQPQQPTTQTERKHTALVLFWKHAWNFTIKLDNCYSRHGSVQPDINDMLSSVRNKDNLKQHNSLTKKK